MALLLCPECENDASDRASVCPHCGFPIAASVVEDAYVRAQQPRSRWGTLLSLFLVALLVGALAWPSMADSGASASAPADGLSLGQIVPHGAATPDAPAPRGIHVYALAKRGQALHQHWMAKYRLEPEAYGPVLFGSATPEPRAAIYVPAAAWDAAGDAAQLELSHYAASLIQDFWDAPEVLAGYRANGPNARFFRENAAGMTSDSWVILGGDAQNRSEGHAALGSLRVLASGAQHRLSPRD